eukprot:scaffold46411_cov68-Phaeocystis_antarctica.AAC.3
MQGGRPQGPDLVVAAGAQRGARPDRTPTSCLRAALVGGGPCGRVVRCDAICSGVPVPPGNYYLFFGEDVLSFSSDFGRATRCSAPSSYILDLFRKLDVPPQRRPWWP